MEFSINANKNNLKIDNYVEVMQKLMQKELTEEISPSEPNNPYFILLLQMDGLEDRMKRKKVGFFWLTFSLILIAFRSINTS